MQLSELDRFFEALARHWPHPARLLLIGGGAALILGGERPTHDVDFEVHLTHPAKEWEAFERAVQAARQDSGWAAQFSETIERWSQMSWLDYQRHTKPYRTFRRIEVRVLEPAYWSLGKIGRYLNTDEQDLVAVFTKTQPDPLDVAQVWAQSLRDSPRSTQLALMRRQAIYFFTTYGQRIWGKEFPQGRVLAVFHPRTPR